ncbi:MAG: segregation/condensation protein A [Gemmatimonadota bacterium]|nr:segregation/condensation protein A [Gemmatimonadota bacterium]MDE2829851.1 segregation/condensation protein A [Gemmatimonadota bacterium]MDE2953272.1 segregation/condensation protein A [Gemmatimonadota bacterium]
MIASNLTARFDPDAAPYGVKLDLFEGPLDLLLFLIQKNEIDIYDIPIADITRQFLEYVEIIQRLNLEVAGDFVVMAATLMRIKSRMLLPSDPEAEEEEGDPREELVRRLLEYQQFREVAAWMDDQQTEYRDVFYRGTSIDLEDIRKQHEAEVGEFRPVSLFELLRAFKQAMDAAPKADFHEVTRVDVTTEERAEYVLDVLERRQQVPFSELIASTHRIVVVVTFVALLELMKEGKVRVQQADIDGELWVYRRDVLDTASFEETTTDV